MWCLLINYYEINGWIMIISTNLSNNFAHYSMKYFVYYSILLVITKEQLQHITTHVCCSRSAVFEWQHYIDIIMSVMASQITSVSIVYSTVCSGVDQRKYQSSASLVHVRGIHRWPVNSPLKGPVAREMFPFDDVIMKLRASASAPTLQITGKQKFH